MKSGTSESHLKDGAYALSGKIPACLTEHPGPLDGTLGFPGPVEPAPGLLEAVHLGLGVHLQELLVVVGVVLGVCVGHGARAGRLGAGRGQHGRFRVACVERACPARPLADVVEVRRAVGVGL